jgi:hypothetical protein
MDQRISKPSTEYLLSSPDIRGMPSSPNKQDIQINIISNINIHLANSDQLT